MVNRIKEIIDHYNLSAAQFADRIGVQRSALSHVLSGRNRPSLDFILKIKSEFPELSLDWITLGKGNQFVTNEKVANQVKEDTLIPDNSGKLNLFTENQHEEDKKSEDNMNMEPKAHRQVKEIVLFYSDGTFERFIPGK